MQVYCNWCICVMFVYMNCKDMYKNTIYKKKYCFLICRQSSRSELFFVFHLVAVKVEKSSWPKTSMKNHKVIWKPGSTGKEQKYNVASQAIYQLGRNARWQQMWAEFMYGLPHHRLPLPFLQHSAVLFLFS